MRRSLFALALLSLPGTSARAEIALLSSGLTLKLDAHRVEDGLVVLVAEGRRVRCPCPPQRCAASCRTRSWTRWPSPPAATCGRSPWPPRGGTASTPSW